MCDSYPASRQWTSRDMQSLSCSKMQVNKAFLIKQNEAHPDSHKIFNRRLTCYPELNRDYQIWIEKVDKPP